MTAPRGRKKLSPEEVLGEEGITLISRRCLKMGFVFQPHRIDHGIDGHIELYDRDSGETLSLTLHVQSKARSTFRYENSDRLKFSLDREHVESWLESNVPVIVIISRPARDEAWWIAVDSACRDVSGAVRTTVTVDKRKQRFDQSARQELIRLAQSTGHRSKVPAGWAPDRTDADVPAPRCPWPGLAPYTTSEAGLFFGREALLDEIGERLFPTEDAAADDRPVPAGLLAVVGASGSGKSSLLNARVVPRFVQETMWITGDDGAAEPFAAAPGGTGSRPEAVSGPIIVTLTPGQDPLGALAERLAPLAGTAPGTLRQICQAIEPLGPSGAVSDRLDSADRTRVEPGVHSGWRLARQAGHASAARPGLLVVDQFEELFTLCADSAARQAFVRAVCALGDGAWFAGPAGPMMQDRLTGPSGPQPVRMAVVLGVRADFYTQCTAYPELAWLLGRNQVVVGPMSKAELLATITQPAAAVGIQLDGGLPEQIVHDLGRGGEADALPMLSHALREAWTASGSGRRLTLAAYQVVGGVEGAIAAKAESTFGALDTQAQSETRRIFLRLVVVRADLSPARQRLDRADLLNSLPPAGKRALDALVASRLLLVDNQSVWIVHEALTREWPRLRDWIEDNRVWLRTRDQLVADADEWDHTGREDSRLYRGARLASTRERLATTSDDDIGRLATAFITASIRREHAEELAEEDQRAQKRTTIRRLRWAVVALVLTTTLAAGAAVYGVTKSRGERDQQQLATSRQLAADSLTMRETDPNLARQLAVLAWETKPTDEARRALFGVLGLPVEVDLGERLLTVARVTAQAPGDLYAVTATSTTAAVWTVGSATEPPRQRDVLAGHSDPVSTAAVSATGTVAATGTDDGTVTVWDLSRAGSPRRTEPLRADPAQAGDEAPTIALSPDGTILAVGYSDGTVEIWNTGSGHGPPAPMGQIAGHCGAVHAVSFSPTGTTFATSGQDAVIRIWATHSPGRPLATLDDRVGANSRNGAGTGATGNDCPTAPEEDSGAEEDRPDVDMGIVGVDPGFDAEATTLVFSPDGALLAAGGDDGAVRLWDTGHLPLPGAKPSVTLDDPAGFIDAMAFDPTGATLATGTEEGSVRLWDVQGSATPQPRAVSVEHTDGIGALAFAPATRDLVTATTTGVLRTSNIAAPGQVRPGLVPLQAAGQTPMTATPTGDMVALVTAAGVIEVRTTADPDHPDRVGAFRPAGTPTSLALSPYGDLLAVGNDDGAISLWDVDRKAGDNEGSAADVPRAVFSAHDSQVASLAFGRGGATLFSVGQDDPDVAVWRMDGTGQPERRVPLALRDGPAETVTISPDGRFAAADTGLGVEVWDISDADSPVAVWMTTTTGTSTATFGPDGLLAVGDEADVTLWALTRPDRPEKRTTIPRAAGSGDYVGALALSGDGRMLAVSGEDGGGPLLWDLTAPTPVRLLNPATDTSPGTSVPPSVVFGGPGAGTLLAAGVDAVPAGTVGIWATEPADLIRRICAEVHIPLTEAGWAAHAGSGDYAPPCVRK